MTTNITPMSTLIANLRWAAEYGKCGTFTFEDNDAQGRQTGKGQTLSQIQAVHLLGLEYLVAVDHHDGLKPLFGTPSEIAELLIRRQLDDDETEE